MPLSEASKGIWVPIPGSCPKGHSEYDDRLLRVLAYAYGDVIEVVELISQRGERIAAHDRDERPTPEQLMESWVIDTSLLEAGKYSFIIFDDVLTRGASFNAAKRMLQRYYPGSSMTGIFLARTVHDDGPEFDFGILDL
jgi:hypothetical protein